MNVEQVLREEIEDLRRDVEEARAKAEDCIVWQAEQLAKGKPHDPDLNARRNAAVVAWVRKRSALAVAELQSGDLLDAMRGETLLTETDESFVLEEDEVRLHKKRTGKKEEG